MYSIKCSFIPLKLVTRTLYIQNHLTICIYYIRTQDICGLDSYCQIEHSTKGQNYDQLLYHITHTIPYNTHTYKLQYSTYIHYTRAPPLIPCTILNCTYVIHILCTSYIYPPHTALIYTNHIHYATSPPKTLLIYIPLHLSYPLFTGPPRPRRRPGVVYRHSG